MAAAAGAGGRQQQRLRRQLGTVRFRSRSQPVKQRIIARRSRCGLCLHIIAKQRCTLCDLSRRLAHVSLPCRRTIEASSEISGNTHRDETVKSFQLLLVNVNRKPHREEAAG